MLEKRDHRTPRPTPRWLMTYATFLSVLLSEGRVRVPAHAEFGPDDLGKGDRVLMDFERFYRQELPGTPPSLDLDAARWAALRFLHACRLIVYRDLGADVVEMEMTVPCPRPAGPGVSWSVDLTFRFLPDLHRFARSAANEDPLVAHLLRWAREWPLSSVGIADVGPIRVDELL